MADLDWDRRGKTFWLLDTFAGLDPRYVTGEHEDAVAAERNARQLRSGFYLQGVDSVRANFAEWRNVRIVQGSVPGTLAEITSPRIAYLHLDMNSAPPEVAALEGLWPRLVPGAIVRGG